MDTKRMTNDQDPRRMREMMGDLEAKTSKPIDELAETGVISNPTMFEVEVSYGYSKIIEGYVAPHQRLKFDYYFMPEILLTKEYIRDLVQKCGFTITGPGIKESIPGLPSDKLELFGYKNYSLIIKDTGPGGVYTVYVMNNYRSYVFFKLNFSTGVWTVK